MDVDGVIVDAAVLAALDGTGIVPHNGGVGAGVGVGGGVSMGVGVGRGVGDDSGTGKEAC